MNTQVIEPRAYGFPALAAIGAARRLGLNTNRLWAVRYAVMIGQYTDWPKP